MQMCFEDMKSYPHIDVFWIRYAGSVAESPSNDI